MHALSLEGKELSTQVLSMARSYSILVIDLQIRGFSIVVFKLLFTLGVLSRKEL